MANPGGGSQRLVVRAAGGPTVVLEFGGLRFVTDPTFDPAGETYQLGPMSLGKVTGPAFDAAEVGDVDAVLLSHDQHPDNLDKAGRAVLARAPRVLTTPSAAGRLGEQATGLESWATTEISRPDGGSVVVTAVPAQHGPAGTEQMLGEVTGFLLTGEGLPTVYVSGDNVSLDAVRQVVDRARVDVAVLHLGGVQLPPFGPTYLSMTAEQAVEAAKLLGSATIVPVHYDGWDHFTESDEVIGKAFSEAGLAEQVTWARPGEVVTV